MKYTLPFALLLGIIGTTQAQIEQNQVYVLADEFWDDICEASPAGDCDSGNLVLLPNNRFALVDRCVSGNAYFSGNYELQTKQLTLNFNRKTVSEIQDDHYNVVGYVDKEIEVGQEIFRIEFCKNRVRLVNANDSTGWKNGSRYESKKETEKLAELLGSKAWKQLAK